MTFDPIAILKLCDTPQEKRQFLEHLEEVLCEMARREREYLEVQALRATFARGCLGAFSAWVRT